MNQDRRLQELQALFVDLDSAGQHFVSARREFILGVREVLFAIERAAQPGTVLAEYIGPFRSLLSLGRAALDRLLLGLSDSDQPTTLSADALVALQAVRALLSEYLLRLNPEQAQDERRGLMTAIGLLDHEIERHLLQTVDTDQENANQPAPTAVQWIEVKE